MKSYHMKVVTWHYHIHISYMQSCHDFMIYDIISLKSYAWDMISRNHHVTYDIIVSSMKSYPWHHCQAYHTYNIWNHTIWNYDIISNFIYDITLWYTGIWHHNMIIWQKSYAWDMISRNQNIWFQVTYDIIVSSMKSYPWNHSLAALAYDAMQPCLWNHSDAYNIIDL